MNIEMHEEIKLQTFQLNETCIKKKKAETFKEMKNIKKITQEIKKMNE